MACFVTNAQRFEFPVKLIFLFIFLAVIALLFHGFSPEAIPVSYT